MSAPIITKCGQGTISAFRDVRVDSTSTCFALIKPEDGLCACVAIRLGAGITTAGQCFVVGDKVRYTLQARQGEFPSAQQLLKLPADDECASGLR
jgi:hypothetical protein